MKQPYAVVAAVEVVKVLVVTFSDDKAMLSIKSQIER